MLKMLNNSFNKHYQNITNHQAELQLIMKMKSKSFFQNQLSIKSIKLLNQVRILSINRFWNFLKNNVLFQLMWLTDQSSCLMTELWENAFCKISFWLNISQAIRTFQKEWDAYWLIRETHQSSLIRTCLMLKKNKF